MHISFFCSSPAAQKTPFGVFMCAGEEIEQKFAFAIFLEPIGSNTSALGKLPFPHPPSRSSPAAQKTPFGVFMCAGEDLNLHENNSHKPLKPACLPVSPPAHLILQRCIPTIPECASHFQASFKKPPSGGFCC